MSNRLIPASAFVRFAAAPLLLAAAWLSDSAARADDKPAQLANLHLMNGDLVSGWLEASARPQLIRWKSPFFDVPFDFELNGVNSVNFPLPPNLPKPRGAYCFELKGGDLLYGELLALDGKGAELDVPLLGRLQVERSHIHRIDRWHDGAGLLYLGPHGLGDWQVATPGAWHEEHGYLSTSEVKALLQGRFDLPERSMVEIEISWTKKPDFSLALAVDPSDTSPNSKTAAAAFRLEAWDRDLVLLRETEKEADVATVQTLPGNAKGAGQAHLQLYLDQKASRCIVLSSKGETLADLKIAGAATDVLSGLRLINKNGDIRLERLRIGRWSGTPPGKFAADQSRLHLVDGSITYGQVASFDAAAKQFVLADQAEPSRIPVEQISSIFMSQPTTVEPRRLSVSYQDSSRISGEPLEFGEASIRLAIPGVSGTLSIPREGMRSLIVLRHDAENAAGKAVGPVGMLELDGVKLRGRLADSGQPGIACTLAWSPEGAVNSSPLRPGASGRVVYREATVAKAAPAPAANNAVAAAAIRARAANAVAEAQLANVVNDPVLRSDSRKALYLRTGDTVPCQVTAIDERGVTIKSSFSDSVLVPHEKIKAVELAADGPSQVGPLTKVKRDRLLTLPRLQRDNPPTHLIRSTNGDFLRGRIASLDAEKLVLEIRLETQEIPRDRIARIIWLHPDELEGAPPREPDPTAGPSHIQAIRNDGIRLTFLPEQVTAGTIIGQSEVLGPCRVALDQVDQILIGSTIEVMAAKLAYQQWKLQHAIEPKFATDDGSPDGARGQESALVGKAAPDFELDMLGGPKFRLSARKGSIVVLDFWATWCGPCIQSLPQVDQVAKDFADRGVQVIAVNLEEAPGPVKSMFERHKLSLPVALDREGTVGGKYGVTSIPQTVVIDRDGKVYRHFIGAGPRIGEELAGAIKSLLDPPANQ